tara:strand:- start:22 stop:258 length:237 start_codon:yes stop_codon:yes gene_type:complete
MRTPKTIEIIIHEEEDDVVFPDTFYEDSEVAQIARDEIVYLMDETDEQIANMFFEDEDEDIQEFFFDGRVDKGTTQRL